MEIFIAIISVVGALVVGAVMIAVFLSVLAILGKFIIFPIIDFVLDIID